MEAKEFIVQLLEKKGGSIHGRVQLQKLTYFCKAIGANINVNYKLYIYGPYSQQVANALQDCVSDDVLIEEDGSISKGANFASFLQSIQENGELLSETATNILFDVLGLCEEMSTKQLEITATTFFIDRQQKVLFGSDDKASVIRKVVNAKGNRFNQAEIDESYCRVVEKFLPLEIKYRAGL